MPDVPPIGAFAIVLCNDIVAAVPFWARLGLAHTGGADKYLLMTGWGARIHLTQAGDGPWAVPAEHNPFGIFIRTPEVDAIASRVEDLKIRPGGFFATASGASMNAASAAPTVCLCASAGHRD